MTTLKDVSQLIQPGDWAVCLDLRDSYFHVSVHTRHRRFLRFIWKEQTYRYTALPFGLSTSPFCFTKVTRPMVQYLRSQGVRVVFYLEDVLLLAHTRRGAQENKRRVVHLLGKLSFSLNHEKSDFVPRQSFSYLGLQWDTRSMQVRLPENKVSEIRSLAASLQDRRVVSARSLMTFFGEGDVCVVRCRAGSSTLTGAANCSEDSLQTTTGHWQDSTPTQGGSPQSRLLERADPCLLYTSPSPRDRHASRMPSSA